MDMKKPQVTISLLASDRPLQDLRRCLDSLQPIREALPCELILIDTSKNPEIHAILLEYSESVYEFEWCKDFAKARNEGLKRAKGEWFLFLDDDEWFVETEELIQFFQSGEYKQYGFADYQVRNFHDEEYVGYSDCWVTRLFKIEKDTHFVSKIHEYFTPIRGEKKHLNTMAYHSGYINSSQEKARARYERNVSLLLEMEKEEPENMRWKLHLVQSYYGAAEWEVLEKYSRACLEELTNTNGKYENIHLGTFYIGLVHSLIYLDRYEESIEICQRALEDPRSTVLLKALMHLKLGENYFRLEQWGKVSKEAAIYLEMLRSVNQSDQDVVEASSALIAGSAFDDGNQKIAYSLLICSQLELGNANALREHYEKLEWDKPVVFTIENIENHMVKAMWTFPYESIFARIMIEVFEKGKLREIFRKAILTQQKQELNVFQSHLYLLAGWMQNIIEGPQQNDLLEYQNTLQQYVQIVCQWCDFIGGQDGLQLESDETPGYLQAAMHISNYFELESQNTIQALGSLKSAVDAMPEFADAIGNFLHFYDGLPKQKEKKQKAEMAALKVQVIDRIKTMVAAGEMDAALQVVGQLKQMFPEDLEVAALALEVRLKT